MNEQDRREQSQPRHADVNNTNNGLDDPHNPDLDDPTQYPLDPFGNPIEPIIGQRGDGQTGSDEMNPDDAIPDG